MKREGQPTASRRIRQMVFCCFYGALIYVLKMLLAGLPNIEPVSLLVFAAGMVCGKKAMLAIAVYAALEVLTWGAGLWNLPYVYVWFMLAWLGRQLAVSPLLLQSAACAGFDLAFGALCALPMVFVSGPEGALAWWMAGIPFDLIHCLSGFVSCLLLLRPVRSILERMAGRFGMLRGR